MKEYDLKEIELILKDICEDKHFVIGNLCFFKHLGNEQKEVFYDFLKNGDNVSRNTVSNLIVDLRENDIEEVKSHFEEV